jgi:hypothetical protein
MRKYQIENIMSLSELHTLIYVSAYAILELNDQEISNDPPNETCKKNKNKKPKWQIRLENKISKLRRDIGKLIQEIKGNIKSSKMEKYINHILQNYNNTDIEIMLDTLKQKLQAYTHRLKRYKKSFERKRHNTLFNNAKKFYNAINKLEIEIKKHPITEQIEQF